MESDIVLVWHVVLLNEDLGIIQVQLNNLQVILVQILDLHYKAGVLPNK